MATDPVCKMEVEPTKAAAKADYQSKTYYFCSNQCHNTFAATPAKYANASVIAEPKPEHGGGGTHRHG